MQHLPSLCREAIGQWPRMTPGTAFSPSSGNLVEWFDFFI
jgi:hypothetical protein